MTHILGWSSRSHDTALRFGPVLHAVHRSLPMASRTGRNFRTACRASVRNVDPGTPFDATLARACLKCTKATAP